MQRVRRWWRVIMCGGVIIVDGYTDPTRKPLFTQEWPLPKVAPAPGVQEQFEAQVQTGISYQTF